MFLEQKMNMNKQTSARYWFIYSKAIKKSRVVGVFLFRILCFNSQLCLVFCTPSPLFIISQQVVISGPKLKENKKETISAELTTLSSFPERSWVFSYHDFFRWRIVLQYWRSFYPSSSAPSWGGEAAEVGRFPPSEPPQCSVRFPSHGGVRGWVGVPMGEMVPWQTHWKAIKVGLASTVVLYPVQPTTPLRWISLEAYLHGPNRCFRSILSKTSLTSYYLFVSNSSTLCAF